MSHLTDIAIQYKKKLEQLHTVQLEKAEMEQDLAANMEDKVLTIPGVGTFERHRKTDRRSWDHDGLRREIIKHTQRDVDSLTGEVESEAEAQMRTFITVAHVDYYRSKELAKINVPIDEFCETLRGGYAIQFIGYLEEQL